MLIFLFTHFHLFPIIIRAFFLLSSVRPSVRPSVRSFVRSFVREKTVVSNFYGPKNDTHVIKNNVISTRIFKVVGYDYNSGYCPVCVSFSFYISNCSDVIIVYLVLKQFSNILVIITM